MAYWLVPAPARHRPHASTTRPCLSLSTPSLHAVAATRDAAAPPGNASCKRTTTARRDAFDGHVQLMLHV